jgi:hypothetical protein
MNFQNFLWAGKLPLDSTSELLTRKIELPNGQKKKMLVKSVHVRVNLCQA